MQHPELLKWFKDFVGFRDGSAGPGGAPADSVLPPADGARVRQERSGDAAMEIGEYSAGHDHDLQDALLVYVSVLGIGSDPILEKNQRKLETCRNLSVSFRQPSDMSCYIC